MVLHPRLLRSFAPKPGWIGGLAGVSLPPAAVTTLRGNRTYNRVGPNVVSDQNYNLFRISTLRDLAVFGRDAHICMTKKVSKNFSLNPHRYWEESSSRPSRLTWTCWTGPHRHKRDYDEFQYIFSKFAFGARLLTLDSRWLDWNRFCFDRRNRYVLVSSEYPRFWLCADSTGLSISDEGNGPTAYILDRTGRCRRRQSQCSGGDEKGQRRMDRRRRSAFRIRSPQSAGWIQSLGVRQGTGILA